MLLRVRVARVVFYMTVIVLCYRTFLTELACTYHVHGRCYRMCCCQKAPTQEDDATLDDAAVSGMERGGSAITLAQILTADKPSSLRAQVRVVQCCIPTR